MKFKVIMVIKWSSLELYVPKRNYSLIKAVRFHMKFTAFIFVIKTFFKNLVPQKRISLYFSTGLKSLIFNILMLVVFIN